MFWIAEKCGQLGNKCLDKMVTNGLDDLATKLEQRGNKRVDKTVTKGV